MKFTEQELYDQARTRVAKAFTTFCENTTEENRKGITKAINSERALMGLPLLKEEEAEDTTV